MNYFDYRFLFGLILAFLIVLEESNSFEELIPFLISIICILIFFIIFHYLKRKIK